MIRLPPKSPAERIDSEVDFAARLAGDTISKATVSTSVGGMSIEIKNTADSVVAVWISGGDPGRYSVLVVTIETPAGRIFEEAMECYCYRPHHL